MARDLKNFYRWQKQRAQNLRFQLLFELGGRCAKCGTIKNLEFDCIIPQGDRHHRYNPLTRIYFYLKQKKLNNIQLLCGDKCHPRKTAAEEQPF